MVIASDSQPGGPGCESRSLMVTYGIFPGSPKFKSSAMLVKSQLDASCQLEFSTLLCCVWNTDICF